MDIVGYTGPWISAQNGDLFSTVTEIKTEMQQYGNNGTGPTVFYSFGAKTSEARGFRDTLNRQGIMFNDILPCGWFTGSGSVGEAVNLVAKGRQALLVARISQGMAELSHGEVFLVVPPDINPYTILKDNCNATPNVWRQVEFPTIQRNSAITQVTKVINAAPYERQIGWLPNDPQYLVLTPSNAETQVSSLLYLFFQENKRTHIPSMTYCI